MYKQIDHEIKKIAKNDKLKLYYAHITRTHTHCYINCQSSHANPSCV